jgi:hypothetical protein
MFKIPAIPSASYLAGGLSMASILSISDDDKPLNKLANCAPDKCVGRPSIITKTLEFPFNEMLSSLSTVTPGNFFKVSSALSPTLVVDSATLNTNLPACCSSTGRVATISTPVSCVLLGLRKKVPKSNRLLPLLNSMASLIYG